MERFQLQLRTGRDSYWGAGKRVLRTQQLDPISRSTTPSSPIQSLKNHESPTPGLESQGGSFYICSHKGQTGREDEKRDESYVEVKLEQLQSTEERLPPAAQPTGQCCVGGVCGKNSHASIWMATQMDCRATQVARLTEWTRALLSGFGSWLHCLLAVCLGKRSLCFSFLPINGG